MLENVTQKVFFKRARWFSQTLVLPKKKFIYVIFLFFKQVKSRVIFK